MNVLGITKNKNTGIVERRDSFAFFAFFHPHPLAQTCKFFSAFFS